MHLVSCAWSHHLFTAALANTSPLIHVTFLPITVGYPNTCCVEFPVTYLQQWGFQSGKSTVLSITHDWLQALALWKGLSYLNHYSLVMHLSCIPLCVTCKFEPEWAEKLPSLVKLVSPFWKPIIQHFWWGLLLFDLTHLPLENSLVAWLWYKCQECSQTSLEPYHMTYLKLPFYKLKINKTGSSPHGISGVAVLVDQHIAKNCLIHTYFNSFKGSTKEDN